MLRWLWDRIRGGQGRPGRVLPKGERVRLIFARLRDAELVATADEALALIHRIVDEVENDHSGFAKQEEPPLGSERMYGPLEDMTRRNIDGSLRARTFGEVIHIGRDGSIRIEKRSGELRLEKPGKGTHSNGG